MKHPKLSKPNLGNFGRTELAILGTTCSRIESLAQKIASSFSSYKVVYIDTKHENPEEKEDTEFDKIVYKAGYIETNLPTEHDKFGLSPYTNDSDLLIINGNHHRAAKQIVVIDDLKKSSLLKRKDQLTDVFMILLKDKNIPDYLLKLTGKSVPIFSIDDTSKWLEHLNEFLIEKTAPIYGLLLNGGKSTRMGSSKSGLRVGEESMLERSARILDQVCDQTYYSIRQEQRFDFGHENVIEDRLVDFGPYGGILSAFMTNPNVAWLVMAIDMPRVEVEHLQRLIDCRNPSKVATAFFNKSTNFPDPLVTIWEPKAYAHLLRFISMGQSCPRKVLINSDVEIINPVDSSILDNINNPTDYDNFIKNRTD